MCVSVGHQDDERRELTNVFVPQAGGGHHGGATRHEALRAAPRVYDAIWISYETLEAEGLLVSPNAAEDHILVAVHRALCQSLVRSRSCMGSTGGDLESGGGTASRP